MGRRRLLPAALVGIAALATGMAWAPHELGRRVFDVLVCALAVATAALTARGRVAVRLPRFWPAVFVPAAWGLLQLVTGATVYNFATWTAVTHWAALGVFFTLAAGAAADAKVRDRMLAGVGVFAAVAVPVCLLQFFTSRNLVFWLFPSGYDAALGPFLNRNTFANFCEVALPVVVWLGVRRPSLLPLTITTAGLFLAAPVATGARAGTVLMAAEAVTIAFVVGKRRRPVLFAAGLAAAALLFAASAGWQTLLLRLKDPDPWMYRREAVESAVAMIRERPLEGFGLGTFQYAYPGYALVDYGVVLNHAHNDWLEFAVEGGVLFGAGMLAGAAAAARVGIRHLWGVGLPFVMLHAVVDFPMQVDAVLVWVLLLAAGASRNDRSEGTGPAADMDSRGRATPVENLRSPALLTLLDDKLSIGTFPETR